MRILLVNLLNIGDVLFMTPAIEALRRLYPEAEVDVLVKHFVADVVKHNPSVTRTIPVDTTGYHRNPLHLAELIGDIRQQSYDYLVDMHGSSRTWLISALSRAKQRYGFAPGSLRPVFQKTATRRTDIHRAESCLEVLREFGFHPERATASLSMSVDDASRESAAFKWQESGILPGETVIGLNPGARSTVKVWFPERWAAVADELDRRGYKTAIFGGPDDLDTVGKLVSAMKTRSRVFTGQLSLLELAAMQSWCRLVISSDTGPLHIAASQGIPVVGLYGNSNPVEFGPYGVLSVVCDGRPAVSGSASHSRSMSNITVEQVLDAVGRLLEQSR